ncbi:hypothetical protein HaLaN_19645 [Haematococcus lacustris]|uniref:Uncharacterized protein n=1 Tax=Haematococcus lacustris TaxID=44745 RepID=A0A699ZHL9_HAELA|nr:hypothetical protein HaLaN_19645 [Haematococcus lacustris]
MMLMPHWLAARSTLVDRVVAAVEAIDLVGGSGQRSGASQGDRAARNDLRLELKHTLLSALVSVIKVPEGAVLRGCKKTRRKLREHFQLRAERRHPMLMPVFEDPSNQALLAKLQDLGSINLAGDANTIDAHSMQLAVAMQQHYSNPGK